MASVVDTYELSPMQAGMLFHGLSGGDANAYIEQVVATLHEPLDEAQFLRAWQRVAERHPVLRSRFRWEGVAQPVQEVVERVQIPVERLDWRAVAGAERQQRFQALLDRERRRGFELDQPPLMRLVFVRAAEREHWVLWTTHHGFLDGRSRFLLWQEVFAFYEAFLRGGDAALPLPRPYRDYIEWLRKFDYDSARTYWQGVLSGYRAPTPLVVARDREAEHDKGDACGTHEVRLSAALTSALRKRAREASVTLNLLLQGAWALLLHRYCGESDIVFGVTRACRGSSLDGAGDMVGLFINTLPIRVRIDPESELVSWLRQLRAQQVALRDYEHTPLVRVQGWSEVPRGMPLFESILVFDSHSLDAQLRALGGAWNERRFLGLGHTNYPLTVVAYGDRELLLQIEYSRKRFDDAVVARMLGHLQTLLEGMAARPEARLKDLPLLTEGERHQLVELWNQTAVAYPAARCVHEMVEEQARIRPEALAAEGGGRRVTYRELDERAEALAGQLRTLGVQSNSLVAVHLERSIEMLVAILGVWKAGGAYVPIDPEYPAERIRFMLEDTKAVVTLTRKHLAAALPASDATVLHVDAPQGSVEGSSRRRLERRPMSPQQLAYVIYTSGSTGRPKGVPIKHASLFNLICWHQQAYDVKPADRATQIAGPAFDGSVWEVWPYLTAGASVHIPDDSTRLDAVLMVRWLAERQITLSFLPTPLAEAVLRENWPETAALRVLLTGGDKLNQRPAKQLPFRLVNHYGPTENSVVSTCAEVTAEGARNAAPSIGRPLPNTRAYVLDRHLQPVPIGVPGELLLGGAQLSSGYWNRADLTTEKFIADPFRPEPGAELYKTGDLVRWLPEGDIEFLGRIDHQVKLRGFRIEPGEIEAGIARHAAVREAVVIAREDIPGDKRLVAYLITESPPADLVDELRALLRTMMPEHMVPAAFVLLDAFPLTPNAKLDRKALPAPHAAAYAARGYEAPLGAIETALAQIWCDVLKLERVGRHDHFFELGGHSLIAMQVVSRVRQKLIVELPLRELFAAPTVSRLAVRIEALGTQPGTVLAIDALSLLASSGRRAGLTGNREQAEL
jgi:amino acid adenylation domain-containing protein